MKRIVISTSTSCLDYLKTPHSIQSIHQHLFINNVHFLDGHNISIDRLQQLILANPTNDMRTEPASRQEIMTIFNDLAAKGYDEVLVLTPSYKLSQSYQIINEVKATFGGRMRIFVLDTKQINISQGLIALDVAEMFLNGATIVEIENHIETLISTHHSLFVVDDLSYLIKSKRLKPTAGFIANLFDIKPVLALQKDGEIKPLDKVRKFERAIDTMVSYLAPSLQASNKFIYILNAGNPSLVAYLESVLSQRFGINDAVVTPVSPVSVATHGPNAVGLGVYVDNIPHAAKRISTQAFY